MSISTFILSPPGAAQNTITRFVQSSEPGDIEAGINAAVAEIAAKNATITSPQEQYGIAAVDLAGGGDGHTFVAQITFTTNTANFLYGAVLGASVPSAILPDVRAGAYLASDKDSLAVAQQVTYDRLRTLDTQGQQFSVIANSFAGAAKGTRFMGLVVGFKGTP